MAPRKEPSVRSHPIPIFYRAIFLYIEPTTILIGAYLAFFQPQTYLSTVHALHLDLSSGQQSILPLAPTISVLLAQLTNVYVLFALLESTVLRATYDLAVWQAFLRGALIADFGHLLVVAGLGVNVTWATLGRLAELGVADWGKPAVMICLRVAFLGGIGLNGRYNGRMKSS